MTRAALAGKLVDRYGLKLAVAFLLAVQKEQSK